MVRVETVVGVSVKVEPMMHEKVYTKVICKRYIKMSH